MFAFTLPPLTSLSLLLFWTRWPIMQKVPSHDAKISLFHLMWLKTLNFRILFTPCLGFFSPFPHGTCSLSIRKKYLGIEGGPPFFKNFTKLFTSQIFQYFHTGLSPYIARDSNLFWKYKLKKFFLNPFSLATTNGVSFDFFSFG